MNMFKVGCMAACLAIASAAMAADGDKFSAIVEQQRALAADLDAGKTGNLTPRQVNAVRKSQKEVFALIEGKTALDQLSIDEKVKLENALERINADVQNGRVASDAKETCWRERMSGSQMKVTRCGTEAERREAREGAHEFLDKPKVCAGDCGSLP